MTKTLLLQYPEDLLAAVNLTPEELEPHMRLMAALKMFELGKLSSAKAAELAAMSKVEFLENCSRFRVSAFNYPDSEAALEVAQDAQTAKDARK